VIRWVSARFANAKYEFNVEIMLTAIERDPSINDAERIAVNQNIESLMTVEWFVTAQQNDTIQIYLQSPVGGFQVLAIPSVPPIPAIPSIITTIYQIA